VLPTTPGIARIRPNNSMGPLPLPWDTSTDRPAAYLASGAVTGRAAHLEAVGPLLDNARSVFLNIDREKEMLSCIPRSHLSSCGGCQPVS
jgi:hypothetical protein